MGRLDLQVSLAHLWHTRMQVKNQSSSSTVTKCYLPVSAGGDKVAFSSSCTLGWRRVLHPCSPCQQGFRWEGALSPLSWHLPWWGTARVQGSSAQALGQWLLHWDSGQSALETLQRVWLCIPKNYCIYYFSLFHCHNFLMLLIEANTLCFSHFQEPFTLG